MKLSEIKIRHLYSIIIFLLIIIGTTHPVYAAKIAFSEDFESEDTQEMTIIAINKTDMRHETGPMTYFDTGFTREYHDQEYGYTLLARAEVTPGEGDFGTNDMIMIDNPTTMQYGTWSFDFYYAVDHRWWKVFLMESTFSNEIKYYEEDVCNESLWIFGGMTGMDYFEFRQLDDPGGETFGEGDKTLILVNEPWVDHNFSYQIGTWYHIDLTRTMDDFSLKINDQTVLEAELSEDIGFSINYFALLTWYGGEVELDNFEFSEENEIPSSANTESSPITTIAIFAGITVVTLITTKFSFVLKKK